MKLTLKLLIGAFLILGLNNTTFAQTVDIKGVDAGAKGDTDDMTLIQIQKGKAAKTIDKPKFEITEGTEDVIGDGAVLSKPAKDNWKKACNEWKAELKENNKGNQVLSSNCGPVNCGSEGNETICRSKATYKLKVRMD